MEGCGLRTVMYERKIEEALEGRLKEIKEELIKEYKELEKGNGEAYKEYIKKLENLSKEK
jgi:hypothetical protein